MDTTVQALNNLLAVLEKARVPRIEDLPYFTSPPVQFVYQSTANLIGGLYQWADAPSTLTPDRPIIDNAVYYFRSVSMIADLSELDYEGALSTTPQFYTYLASDANAVLFREPVLMTKYLQNFDYRLLWTASRGANQLRAGFTGRLVQTNALIGKTSVTLKAIISAQEIVDEEFSVPLRTLSYPRRVK